MRIRQIDFEERRGGEDVGWKESTDKTRQRGNWAKYEGILKQERGKEKKENWYENGDTEETNAGRRKTIMMLVRMEEERSAKWRTK